MSLYSRADFDEHTAMLDALDVGITRLQLAGRFEGLKANALHAEVANIRALCEKQLARTRFILQIRDGDKAVKNPRRGAATVTSGSHNFDWKPATAAECHAASASGKMVRWNGNGGGHVAD